MTAEGNTRKKVWPQIITLLIVGISSITAGAQYGWTSPFVVKITQDTVNYNITEDETSHFVMLHIVAYGIFGLFTPKLSDMIGRKPCMFLLVVPQAAFWIITAFTRSAMGFYIARVISGIADAVHYGVVPVYMGEIADPKIRGTWGNVMVYCVLGQLYINAIAQWFTVWETAYISLGLCGLYLLLLGFTPESPYYDLMKKKHEKAVKSLSFLNGTKHIEREYWQLKLDIERQMSEHGRWVDLIKIEANRKAITAAIVLRLSQQFSGVMVFQSYTQFIFEKSGSRIDSGLSAVIIAGLSFVMTFSAGFLGEYLGRRKSYILSNLSCAIILLTEATYFYIDQNTHINVESITWFPLMAMIAYIICSSFGLTPIPQLMMGELFSSSIKAKGTSFMTFFVGMMCAANLVGFYQINSHFGLYVPFAAFGVISILTSPLVWKVLPETSGRSLEEIQQSLMKKKRCDSDEES